MVSHLEHWNPQRAASQDIYLVGTAAVIVFFCISGFIIALSHREEVGVRAALVPYLVKRAFRIYPAYLFFAGCAAAVAFLGWWSWDNNALMHRTPAEVFSAVTLIPLGRAADVSFLAVGWSLFFEVVFYVLFSAFFLSVRAGAVTLAIFAALALTNQSFLHLPLFWLCAKSVVFVVGCACGFAYRPGKLASRSYHAAVIVGVALFVLSAFAPGPYAANVTLQLGAVLAVVVVTGFDTSARRRPNFLVAPLVKAGDISYSLYLCHIVVHTVLFHFLGAPGDSWWVAALFLVAPLPVAWAGWKWVEQPAQRAARRFAGIRRMA